MNKIPFFKPTIGEEEKKAINDVIDSGWLVMGPKTKEFEEKFAEYVSAEHAVFVDSGTAALFLALKWQEKKLGISLKGQIIETPSLTFVSDAEVIYNLDALPKFIDVNPKTFCVDEPERTEGNLRIAVHLTGNEANSPATIYDSAHRIEKDDVRGSQVPWCYSFYATKNMSTIQGGMIALNDWEGAKWLRAARDHGISKGTLERYTQKTPTYSIDFVGYRLKADDLRAAIGLEQLKKLPAMTQRRNEIITRYNRNLNLHRTGNHLYPILVSDRDAFFEAMELAQIQCSVHFLPLHQMPAFKKYSPKALSKYFTGKVGKWNNLKHTEYLGKRLVSLPLFPDMTNEQVDYVSERVLDTKLMLNE